MRFPLRRSLVALLLFGLVLGVAASLWWWRAAPARHLAQAERLVGQGDLAEALEWLPVPESAPATRDRALLLKARIAIERGRLPEAARALDGASAHGPWAADYAFWKGRTLLAARQPLLAIPWFEASLRIHPRNADAHRWLAAAAYDLGDRARVVNALQTVLDLEPNDARAWRTLGLVWKENVEYERARAAYENTLRLDPSQPQARLELAEVLVALGDSLGAEGQLAACRGRVPEGARADLLGQCRKLQGDLKGQRAAVAAGLAAAPDHPGLLCQQAQIELGAGHTADALRLLNRAVAANPYRAETFYLRAVTLRLAGRPEQAKYDFDRSTELKRALAEMSDLNETAARAPGDAEVRYKLGQICAGLGKPELAASWYRAALACDPRHAGARRGLQAVRGR